MPNITRVRIPELEDPKLREVAERVLQTLQLAAEKAVAHHTEPGRYPVFPDPHSLEQIFLSRFRELRPQIQQIAVDRVMPRVLANEAARVQMYGNLAKIDLRSATLVDVQVNALELPAALKFTESDLKNLRDITHRPPEAPGLHPRVLALEPEGSQGGDREPPGDWNDAGPLPRPPVRPRPRPSQPPQPPITLRLRLLWVKCIDETNPEWTGKDEIRLGGNATEGVSTRTVRDFKVGDFNDGDEVRLRRYFTSFYLRRTGEWPRAYNVMLILAEEDMGDLADFLNELADWVQKKIENLLGALAAELISASLLATLVALALNFVVGEIFDRLRTWWGDEIFPPACDLTIISAAPSSPWTDEPVVWGFSGYGGTYELAYRWEIA